MRTPSGQHQPSVDTEDARRLVDSLRYSVPIDASEAQRGSMIGKLARSKVLEIFARSANDVDRVVKDTNATVGLTTKIRLKNGPYDIVMKRATEPLLYRNTDGSYASRDEGKKHTESFDTYYT